MDYPVLSKTFALDLTDAVLNVLLPSTDRVVFIQWAVCALFWPLPLWWASRQERDKKHFIYGLAMANLAWFAIRTVH